MTVEQPFIDFLREMYSEQLTSSISYILHEQLYFFNVSDVNFKNVYF